MFDKVLMGGLVLALTAVACSATSSLPGMPQTASAAAAAQLSSQLAHPAGRFTGRVPRTVRPTELLAYSWTYSGTTTSYQPSPKPSPFSGSGVRLDTYGVDASSGIYLLQQSNADATRHTQETVETYFGLKQQLNGQLQQVSYLDTWGESSAATGEASSGQDEFASGDVQWIYPLVPGTSWTAQAEDVYSYKERIPKAHISANGAFAFGADGSYTGQDQVTFPNGGVENGFAETFAVQGSGLGSYGYSDAESGQGEYVNVLSPRPQADGWVIPTVNAGNETDVPDWYPGGQAAQLPLASDFRAVKGTTVTPGVCAGQGNVQATEVDETYSDLDTVQGIVENDVVTYYFGTNTLPSGPSMWPICELVDTNVTLYDDGVFGNASGTPYLQTSQNNVYVLTRHTPQVASRRTGRAPAALPMFAGGPTLAWSQMTRAELLRAIVRRRAKT